jgi:hypothetical protein
LDGSARTKRNCGRSYEKRFTCRKSVAERHYFLRHQFCHRAGPALGRAGPIRQREQRVGRFDDAAGFAAGGATFAVTHYIAHFNASGDSARLQGLLLGCRKFLFRFTITGSVLAMIVTKPLSDFFHYNESLMLVTLGCALLGLWASLATALCPGLAWFKRLALIGFLAMLLRVSFGWLITFKWPSAETAVEPRVRPILHRQRGVCGRQLLFFFKATTWWQTNFSLKKNSMPMPPPEFWRARCP